MGEYKTFRGNKPSRVRAISDTRPPVKLAVSPFTKTRTEQDKMKDLIQFLNKSNIANHQEKARNASIQRVAIHGETRDTMKEIARLSDNHITDRLTHLTSISKLLVLAGEDESNGIFEQFDLTAMGYFLQSELEALQVVYEIKGEAEYSLAWVLGMIGS